MKSQYFHRGSLLGALASISLAACGVPEEAGLSAETAQTESALVIPGSRVLTDVVLIASDSSSPPSGPAGYVWVGHWDADRGGSLGTDGSTGSFMMAMYARYVDSTLTANCVRNVEILASNNNSLPWSRSPNWVSRGYWDAHNAGAYSNTNGSSGSFMTGLYTDTGSTSGGSCITDLQLVASNNSSATCINGYACLGYWDVDNGGSMGTNGSTGSYMMTLSAARQ